MSSPIEYWGSNLEWETQWVIVIAESAAIVAVQGYSYNVSLSVVCVSRIANLAEAA